MKRSNTIIFTFLVILTSVLFFTSTSNAQLVGGTTYPINGVESPPTSFNNLTSAVAYLTTNGVTGSGQVIMEFAGGYPGELAPVLIPSITGTNATLGITFRPAVGTTITTSIPGGASPNQHAIRITGSYITLDGRGGGIGNTRDWTVRATGSGTTGLGQMAVRLDNTSNSMTGLVIRNLIMEGEASNTTGAIFQITGGTTNTISNVIIEQNLIQSAATIRGYGITVASASNVGNTGVIIRNNVITQFYARGINLTGGFPGIEVYGNEIYHSAAVTQPTATEFSAFYFSTTASAGAKIYNNYIHDIQSTNGSTAANGIYFFNGNTSGLPIEIFNNRVQIGNGIAATTIPIYGIRDNAVSGALFNIYYNSVFVDGSPSAGTSNSAAFRKEVSNFINLKNNIFYNARSNSGGTGVHWGISVNNTTFASINNNDYFANGTGGVLGTTTGLAAGNKLTILEWKAAVLADVNSVSQDPNYVAGLKINTAIATQLESGGTPVASVTLDFEGDLRNATTPDIGADEFAGIALDLTAPLISYSALLNTGSTTARTLVASISDLAGVPTSGIGLPVLYWAINSGSFTPVQATYVSGNNYSFTFGAGVVLSDTVKYFVVAQDNATTPNVGAFPTAGAGGFSINPPAASTPPTLPSSYLITQAGLVGNYTVGLALFNSLTGNNISFLRTTQKVMKEVWVAAVKTDRIESSTETSYQPSGTYQLKEVEEFSYVPMQDGQLYTGDLFIKKSQNPEFEYPDGVEGIYATITAALADLNLRGVSGATSLLLVDATYPTETYPLTVNIVNENLPTSTNLVTIKPNTGITAVISGALASGPLFRIRNSYVTIDGSNSGGSDRSLTIQNTSITSPQVINIASSGTTPLVGAGVKNCVIINGVNTSSAIVVNDFTGVAGYFNNITIQNNSIQKAYIGVFCNAFVASGNGSGLLINRNNIETVGANSVRYVGIYVQGASGANVSENIIGNFDGASGEDDRGIWFATGTTNSIVEKNRIFTLKYTGTGGYGAYGVAMSSATLNANNNIVNNVIYDLSGDGWNYTTVLGDNPHGIYIFGTQSGINVYYNSINLFGNTLNQTSALSTGICLGTGSIADIRDNNIVNSLGLSAATGYGSAGVFVQTSVTQLSPSNYNNLFVNPTGSGAKNVGQVGATGYTTLNDWKVASSQDSNSISANPNFVASNDLRPLFPSPVFGAGTPIAGITTDFLSATRNITTPTIGAYEQVVVLPLAGDYYIPKGSNPNGFDNLEDAIFALNTAGATGAVRFLIDDNLNEVGANLLITRSDLTPANNLIIKPAPTKTPIITITGASTVAGASQYSGISYSGASNITIDGSNTVGGTTRDLTIAMNDSLNGRIGIQLYGNTDNIVFKNLYLKFNLINLVNASTRGIYANGQASGVADSLIIENCQIADITYAPAYAISITGSSGSSLYASKVNIKNNSLYGVMRPLYFFYGGAASTTSEISNNVINQPYPAITGNVIWGILFNTFDGTINIFGNKIQKLVSITNATQGIYGIGTLTSQPGVVMNIYNNFLGGDFQHNGTGIPASIDVISFQDNIPQANVYHNTIVLNNMTKTASGRMTGVRWGGTANVTLRNNIIINDKDAPVAFALYNAGGTFTSNYNDLYVSGASANIGFSGVARQSFQTWKDSTGQDANSVNVSAPFAAPLDFHIPDGTVTALESAGTPIAMVTTDIDGQARNLSTPDIGADEFAGLLLINAPSNLIAVADTFAILLSWADNSTNELGFYIERKDGDSLSVNPFVVIDTVGVGVVSYNDLGRTPNTTYTYRVQAYNLLGVSAYSNVITATTIVPVELTSFVANVGEKEISIMWSTATELNNRGFELERMLNADWQKVVFIEGKGTTTEKSDYSYADKFNFDGFQGIIQYRLKQIDYDGTITYSKAISVEVDFTPKEYTLYQNYPNPFNPSTTIKFALPFDSNVRITIYNLLGEQVEVIFDQVKEVGYHNVSWNAGNLASGVYMYSIEAKSVDGLKNYNTVKKMMLIK